MDGPNSCRSSWVVYPIIKEGCWPSQPMRHGFCPSRARKSSSRCSFGAGPNSTVKRKGGCQPSETRMLLSGTGRGPKGPGAGMGRSQKSRTKHVGQASWTDSGFLSPDFRNILASEMKLQAATRPVRYTRYLQSPPPFSETSIGFLHL